MGSPEEEVEQVVLVENAEESKVGTGQEQQLEYAEEDVEAGNVVDVPEVPENEFGERKQRIARRPYTPTKAEIAEHFPLHVHYRSWCPHCRAGKSIGKQHKSRDPNDEPLGVEICVGYAFKGVEEAEEDVSPVLVAYNQNKNALWTLEVDHKGEWAQAGWLTRSNWQVIPEQRLPSKVMASRRLWPSSAQWR